MAKTEGVTFTYSRRLFLKQVMAIGTVGLFTACGNQNGMARVAAGPNDQTSLGEAAAGKCEGNADLPAGDVAARQAINYVEASPHADKVCANCRFFKQPVAGAACGGCEIVKGPIAPEGYCNTWAT